MKALILGTAILLAGCSSTNIAELVKAMAGDNATACASGTYAGAQISYSRTNILNGEVTCNANGMTVKSTPVPAR